MRAYKIYFNNRLQKYLITEIICKFVRLQAAKPIIIQDLLSAHKSTKLINSSNRQASILHVQQQLTFSKCFHSKIFKYQYCIFI